MLFTQPYYTFNYIFGKHSFVIIFQYNYIGIFSLNIISKSINQSFFIIRNHIIRQFCIKPHHVLVTANDTDFVGGNPVLTMYQVFYVDIIFLQQFG